MEWALAALVAFVVIVLVVDRRRGGSSGSGRNGSRDAHTAQGSAIAGAVHGGNSSNNTGSAA